MLQNVRPREDSSAVVVPRQNADKRRPDGHTVQLYGWDSRSHSWHGPNELGHGSTGTQKLYEALRGAPGQSWYGPVNCSASGEPGRFFALAHALRDCGVAMVYCDESKSGPAEIVTVIPAEQRARLRPEFAFEFVAFAGFLGSIGTGADMAVNDCIEAALAETAQDDSLVFSISTGLWVSDLDHVLSRCVEKIAIAMLRWLEHSKI